MRDDSQQSTGADDFSCLASVGERVLRKIERVHASRFGEPLHAIPNQDNLNIHEHSDYQISFTELSLMIARWHELLRKPSLHVGSCTVFHHIKPYIPAHYYDYGTLSSTEISQWQLPHKIMVFTYYYTLWDMFLRLIGYLQWLRCLTAKTKRISWLEIAARLPLDIDPRASITDAMLWLRRGETMIILIPKGHTDRARSSPPS